MGRQTGSTMERRVDPHRGQTWREVWARNVKAQPTPTTRVTKGGGTKPPQPEGTTPLERDQRPINQSR